MPTTTVFAFATQTNTQSKSVEARNKVGTNYLEDLHHLESPKSICSGDPKYDFSKTGNVLKSDIF